MRVNIHRVIRPHVPDLMLHRSLRRRVQGEDLPPNPNRFPLYVQYKIGGRLGRVQVRDVDSVYFSNTQTAPEHLDLILKARTGRNGAISELKKKATSDLAVFAGRFNWGELDLGRFDDVVIPFTDTAEHTADVVSNKGLSLLRLHRLGFPVPAFCIISSRWKSRWRTCWERYEMYDAALRVLEALTGKKHNDPENPLLFSMRSAQPEYMPGIMPTYLNFGASDEVFPTLVGLYGEEAALDIRINHLMTLVLDSESGPFSVQKYTSRLRKLTSPYPADIQKKRELLAKLETITRGRYLTFNNPGSHVGHFGNRILSFNHDNADTIRSFLRFADNAVSIILQEMVFGVAGYSGVFFTTNPQTGEGQQLLISRGRFGEDVMSGCAAPEDVSTLPPEIDAYQVPLVGLQQEWTHPLVYEVTVEQGTLAVLQVDRASLTGPVALGNTMLLHRCGDISAAEVFRRIKPYHVRQLFADQIVSKEKLEMAASGIPVLPDGDVCGHIYFSNETALEARARGERVILASEFFNPADVDTMVEMQGLLSIASAAVHVGEIARRYGIVALVGLEKEGQKVFMREGRLVISTVGGEREINEGDIVTISSREERLYVGEAKTIPSSLLPTSDLEGYHGLVMNVSVEEIEDVDTLNNVVSYLMFRGEQERLGKLVNAWFAQRSQEFLDYFSDTDIGKHRPRINLFLALNKGNCVRFMEMLLTSLGSRVGSGTFIVGRLLLELGEHRGEDYTRGLIGSFTGPQQKRMEVEIERAIDYLQVSRVPARTASASQAPAAREDVFTRALKMKLGEEAYAALGAEQLASLRRFWNLDPDPEHKPHKTITRALSRAKKT